MMSMIWVALLLFTAVGMLWLARNLEVAVSKVFRWWDEQESVREAGRIRPEAESRKAA
jgi:hypothetical protein